jgi:hypothetical protein
MARFSVFVVAAGVFCLGTPGTAGADPIRITSGSFTLTGPAEVGSIAIAGTRGFSLQGQVDPGEGSVNVLSDCTVTGCLPGSRVGLDGSLGGPAFPDGIASLDGITYDDIDSGTSPAGVFFTFTGEILLPGFRNSSLQVAAPFRVTGGLFSLEFPAQSASIDGGHGTAVLWLNPRTGGDLPDRWILDQVRYEFTDAAPVPEPATLLLVGTGVLAACRLRGHRRRALADGPVPS